MARTLEPLRAKPRAKTFAFGFALGLLGASLAAGLGGCSSGSDPAAPAVVPGAVVGKVVELTGAVTATRGGQPRPLAANAEVRGDDTISTAQDGRVVIVLAHNNARWELGPNRTQLVSQSMAWGLPRQEGGAQTVDEVTTAAGRHAERSAATGGASSESSERTRAEPVAAPAAEPVAAPVAPAPGAPGPPPAETVVAQPTPPADKRPARTAVPAKPSSVPRGANATSVADDEGGTTAKGDAQVVAATRGPGAGEADSSAVKAKQAKEVHAVKAAEPVDQLQPILAQEHEALQACLDKSKLTKLTIVVKVVGGKATIELSDSAATAADRRCFAGIAQRIKLAGPASSTVTLTR